MRSLNLEGVRLPFETEKEKADTKLQRLKRQCFKVTQRLKRESRYRIGRAETAMFQSNSET